MSNNHYFFIKGLHLFDSVSCLVKNVAPMRCIFNVCPGSWLLFILCMIVCLRQIKESYFIDGVPIQNAMFLAKKSFYAAWRLTALSLIQGGPNPAFLLESSYKFISNDSMLSPSELCYPKSFIDENQPIQKVQYVNVSCK